MGPEDRVAARLHDWRGRLIDLTYRNRLIRYTHQKASSLAIATPDIATIMADPERARPWRFYLPPEEDEQADDESDTGEFLRDTVVAAATRHRTPTADELVVTEPSAKRIVKNLDNLAKKSNAEFEDKALRVLYLAVGFLDWVDPQRGQAISSPLVLVPVRFARANATQPYEMYFVDDEDIVINPSLTEKLRVDAGLELDDDWAWEDKPIQVELDEIRRIVAPHGWSVREDAALGLFSFQKYVMYRDLLDNETVAGAHPIVRALALSEPLPDKTMPLPEASMLDEVQAPERSFSIRDADASQRHCLEAAARGQSFVMHGPPGTGKSQTIANLIADAIGRGKKVLFVSEKAAALDVVYDRLAEQDLSEYVLMLHGERAARREVVHALHASLTSELEPRRGMDRDEHERLAMLRRLLNESASELHVDQPLLGGRPLREVYGRLAPLHAAPVAPGAPAASDAVGEAVGQEFQGLLETFERLAERWRVAHSGFPWRGFARPSLRDDERGAVLAALDGLGRATEQVQQRYTAIAARLGVTHDPRTMAARAVLELSDELAAAPQLEADWLRPGSANAIQAAVERARGAHAAVAEAERRFSEAAAALRVEDVPERAGTQLTAAVDGLELAIGRTPAWSQTLIQDLHRLQRAEAELPAHFDEIDQLASEVSERLGHVERPRRLSELSRLVELATLAFVATDRPDPEWMVGPALIRARAALEQFQAPLRDYQALRAALQDAYERDAFDLDLRALRTRFRTDWDAEFLEREHAYRRDLDTLAAARIDGETPEDPPGDLAAFQQHEATRLSAEQARTALLARFTPAALELDGPGLHERFSTQHTGTFAKLGKQYRADARTIKEVRPDGKLGDDLVADLAELSRFQALQAEAEAQNTDLSTRYRPAAFALPHGELAERFQQRYTPTFLARHRAYHADLRAINEVRREGALAENEILGELDRFADLQALGRTIDDGSERQRVAFASFYLGRDTDTDAVARALDVAEQALRLADRDADVAALRAQLTVGTVPDPQLTRAAEQLRGALAAADERLRDVETLAAKAPAWRDLDVPTLRTRALEALSAVHPLAAVTDALTKQGRSPATLDELMARAHAADAVRATRSDLAAHEAGWAHTLGARYAGADTPWDELLQAASYLRALQRRFVAEQLALDQHPDRFVPDGVADRLLAAPRQWRDADELRQALAEFDARLRAVVDAFEPERRDEFLSLGESTAFATMRAVWAELAAHVDDLNDYIELRRHRGTAARLGWGVFVEHLLEEDVAANAIVAAFERAWWTRRLERLEKDNPELFADDGATYARWIDEFRALDRRLVATGADRLIAARNRHRPALVDGVGSEVTILKAEAGKRRRFRPVRKLLAQMPTLLSELKPCLMMSPLTVSHFLSPDHRFDLVVFDEASQVPPWDAINCIYRGAQLIVAGDSKQLPPTSFFQRAESDDGFDEEADRIEENQESVLDACNVLLAEHPLRWHYRSRNERLIAFSNRHVYDDTLWTFPGAAEDGTRTGIGFVHVPDGIYDRGRSTTNRREARVVAERVVAHLGDGSNRSLGVITFNAAQAEAVEEELDRQRIEHPHLEPHFNQGRLDSVFVKHIEAVQGDERDVILFSIGYGYDEQGSFPMNFGPLGSDGGHRRLNVAVTRAREYVEVVSSVLPSDFTLSESARPGPRLLKRYLEYAREKAAEREAEPATDVRTDAPSQFEAEVAEVIHKLGYEVAFNVGRGPSRIDIGVRHPAEPSRFMLGIVTDGPNYARVPTARDRDRLRNSVFEHLGWRLYPLWSIDWVKNRREQVQRLEAALTAARDAEPLEDAPGDATPAVVASAPEVASAPSDEGERVRRDRPLVDVRDDPTALPWVHVYECAELAPVTSRFYDFADAHHQRRQVEMVIEVANVEAPIHVEQLARRLADAFGVDRVTKTVQTAVNRAVEKAARQAVVERRGDFLWRRGQAMPPIRTPDPDDPRTRRDIEQIACLELTSAVVRMRKASPGAELEHLIPQAARVFGFDRTSARIRDRFEDCLRRVSRDLDALAEDG